MPFVTSSPPRPPCRARQRYLLAVATIALAALAACDDGGGLGAACDSNGDCADRLQCLRNACIARCERAPECGDGYSCRVDGMCIEAVGALGNQCSSETDCASGLACVLDASTTSNAIGTCRKESNGHAYGAACRGDAECRTGTCELGRCVDLCQVDRDCPLDAACMRVPRTQLGDKLYHACLPARGQVTWDIPVVGSAVTVKVPIPENARGLSLVMTVDDESQRVGATRLDGPTSNSRTLYRYGVDDSQNLIRYRPAREVSVIQLPSSSAVNLLPGAYAMALQSFSPIDDTIGSAIPRLRATVSLYKPGVAEPEESRTLQLHFHFVDLEDHPCKSKFGVAGKLDAESAKGDAMRSYFEALRLILAPDIVLAPATFDNLPSASRGNIAPEHVRALLRNGLYQTGINVFFVRSLSPAGTRSVGPTPGTIGVRGTRDSGIVISLEQLCYSDWNDLARTTARQIARYLGLFPTIDATGIDDPIEDTFDSTSNLMYYSDQGGTMLTKGQRDIIAGSPVLQ